MIPLDPFISLGLMTVAFAGVGWLVGPSIGGQVFYLLNGRLKPQIKQKEAEFFARVKKNRVDPTNSSAANPGKHTPSSNIEQSANSIQCPITTARRFKAFRATGNGSGTSAPSTARSRLT